VLSRNSFSNIFFIFLWILGVSLSLLGPFKEEHSVWVDSWGIFGVTQTFGFEMVPKERQGCNLPFWFGVNRRVCFPSYIVFIVCFFINDFTLNMIYDMYTLWSYNYLRSNPYIVSILQVGYSKGSRACWKKGVGST